MNRNALFVTIAILAGCGQPTATINPGWGPRPHPFPPHHPLPHPPTQSWTCQIIGKDGDVFGNFTGTGSTEAQAEANGLAACKAVPDYASCWVNSCAGQ